MGLFSIVLFELMFIMKTMIIQGRQLIEILPLKDLYTIHKEHHRLTVFVNKGRECVTCSREGVFLLVTAEKNGALHVDLYTKDFIMMTVDHVIPKKIAKELGWTKEQIESLDNKQPMCGPCNWSKDSKLVTNEEHKTIRKGKENSYRRRSTEIIWELVDNETIFDRNLA